MSDHPTYELRTIAEIFDMLTPDNVESFCKDFTASMISGVAIRETAIAMAEKDGIAIPPDGYKMTSFTWIDDGEHNIKLTLNPAQ